MKAVISDETSCHKKQEKANSRESRQGTCAYVLLILSLTFVSVIPDEHRVASLLLSSHLRHCHPSRSTQVHPSPGHLS